MKLLDDIASSASAPYFASFIKLYVHTQNTQMHKPNWVSEVLLQLSL